MGAPRRVELRGRQLRVGDRIAMTGRTVTAITRDMKAGTLSVTLSGGRVMKWNLSTPLIIERT